LIFFLCVSHIYAHKSLLLLSATLGIELARDDFIRQRSSHSELYTNFTRYLLKSTHPNAVKRKQLIIDANGYDMFLWNQIRQRQCNDLKSMGLLGHEVVKRDLEVSHLSACS
jgi:hypothetical protein